MTYTTHSAEDMKELAHTLVDTLIDARVVLLSGDLGAGKTTFVQGVAEALGIDRPVRSPTYTLINEHPVNHPRITRLVHGDLYRLDRVRNLQDPNLGLAEYLQGEGALVLIEWPERLDVPPKALTLKLEAKADSHTLTIETKTAP